MNSKRKLESLILFINLGLFEFNLVPVFAIS